MVYKIIEEYAQTGFDEIRRLFGDFSKYDEETCIDIMIEKDKSGKEFVRFGQLYEEKKYDSLGQLFNEAKIDNHFLKDVLANAL